MPRREILALAELRFSEAEGDPSLIDVLFLRTFPTAIGDESVDAPMNLYERALTVVTWNRPVELWALLLGDSIVVLPSLDRRLACGHLRKFARLSSH